MRKKKKKIFTISGILLFILFFYIFTKPIIEASQRDIQAYQKKIQENEQECKEFCEPNKYRFEPAEWTFQHDLCECGLYVSETYGGLKCVKKQKKIH